MVIPHLWRDLVNGDLSQVLPTRKHLALVIQYSLFDISVSYFSRQWRGLFLTPIRHQVGAHPFQTFFTAFECTATALPEGSSIFSNSLLHRNATGEEQAMDGPASTVKAASFEGYISSNIWR